MTSPEDLLPADVVQFLRSHVQSRAAYDLLMKYGDEDTVIWARRRMALASIKDGEMVFYDRRTGEEFERISLRNSEGSDQWNAKPSTGPRDGDA